MSKGESEKMSWQNQDTVFLVMWRSRKSGATLSELKKTEAGKNRLVATLLFLGYAYDDLIIVEKDKAWKPTKTGGFVKKNTEDFVLTGKSKELLTGATFDSKGNLVVTPND